MECGNEGDAVVTASFLVISVEDDPVARESRMTDLDVTEAVGKEKEVVG